MNPFSAPTTFETLRRVQACEYPPVELLRPDVPAELVRSSKTAMAQDAGRPLRRRRPHVRGAARVPLRAGQPLRRARSRRVPRALPRRRARRRRRAARADARGRGAATRARERTPVEVPSSRQASSVARRERASRFAAIDRAAEHGRAARGDGARHRAAARDAPAAVGRASAASIVERWGGRVLRREAGHIAALFGLGDPDGRDTEMATRCALVALRGARRGRAPASAASTPGASTSRATASRPRTSASARSLDTARDLARVREGVRGHQRRGDAAGARRSSSSSR